MCSKAESYISHFSFMSCEEAIDKICPFHLSPKSSNVTFSWIGTGILPHPYLESPRSIGEIKPFQSVDGRRTAHFIAVLLL